VAFSSETEQEIQWHFNAVKVRNDRSKTRKKRKAF
jgi:hypothetical protein